MKTYQRCSEHGTLDRSSGDVTEPSAPVVDLVTGKFNPGKVSRTVSTSPLALDMTVMCIPEPEILQPMAVTQGALSPDTVNKTVAGFDTSTPAVATPATVVGKPDPQSKDFPTLRLSESSDLLPSFGLVLSRTRARRRVSQSRIKCHISPVLQPG